jgi:hypothetical protein
MVKMSDHINIYKRYIVADFESPLYSHEKVDIVRLDEKWIKLASKTYRSLVIRTPHGECIHFPKTVLKECKLVKEVFLRPEEPMRMREIPVPYSEKADIDKYKFS